MNLYDNMEPGEVILVVQDEDPFENIGMIEPEEPGEPPSLSMGGCMAGTLICLLLLFGIVMLLIDLYRILT
jgi:hypothetical protein